MSNPMASATPLVGKIVLITGGTKGIGRASVQLMAAQGATVVATYGGDQASADSLSKEIGPEKFEAIKSDASSLPALKALVETVVQKHGRIDILIPCAAALAMMDLKSTTEEQFDKLYSLNVKGVYFLCQYALPHIPKGGRVILFSTNQCHASTVTGPYLLYTSTKGAIEQMVRIMGKELAKDHGINVNCISPGPTGTELFYRGKSQQMLDMIAGFSPFNRIGTPEELAGAISFLAGPQSTWVTGQVLRCNGGMS